VASKKAADLKASNLRPHGSRKTSEVELASQILKRVLQKTESKVKMKKSEKSKKIK
jgi:hypothetical protein